MTSPKKTKSPFKAAAKQIDEFEKLLDGMMAEVAASASASSGTVRSSSGGGGVASGKNNDVFRRLSLTPKARMASDSVFSFLTVRAKESPSKSSRGSPVHGSNGSGSGGSGDSGENGDKALAAALMKDLSSAGTAKALVVKAIPRDSRLMTDTASQRHSRDHLAARLRHKEAKQAEQEERARQLNAPPPRKKTTVRISESLTKPNQNLINRCAVRTTVYVQFPTITNPSQTSPPPLSPLSPLPPLPLLPSARELEERRFSPDSKIGSRRDHRLGQSPQSPGHDRTTKTTKPAANISARLLQRTRAQEQSIQAFIKEKGEITDDMDPWWELRSSKLDALMEQGNEYGDNLKTSSRSRLYSHTDATRGQAYVAPEKAVVAKPKYIEMSSSLLAHTKGSTKKFERARVSNHLHQQHPLIEHQSSNSFLFLALFPLPSTMYTWLGGSALDARTAPQEQFPAQVHN